MAHTEYPRDMYAKFQMIILKMLLECPEIDINIQQQQGFTPLLIALEQVGCIPESSDFRLCFVEIWPVFVKLPVGKISLSSLVAGWAAKLPHGQYKDFPTRGDNCDSCYCSSTTAYSCTPLTT